jgi:hypothetical protein
MSIIYRSCLYLSTSVHGIFSQKTVILILIVIIISDFMNDSVTLFPILEWSREALLEKWMKDPVQCCQLAGVQPPTSALQHCASEPSSVTLQCSNVEPPGCVQQQGTTKPCAETIVSILLCLFWLGTKHILIPDHLWQDNKNYCLLEAVT